MKIRLLIDIGTFGTTIPGLEKGAIIKALYPGEKTALLSSHKAPRSWPLSSVWVFNKNLDPVRLDKGTYEVIDASK
jgi:hypothetical protein